MKKILIKLGVFLIVCIIFSVIYLFIPDKNFGGINKIQTILEEELVEKAVEKKIKETFKNKNSSDVNLNSISSEIDNVIDLDSTNITDIKKESYFDKYFDRLYFSIDDGIDSTDKSSFDVKEFNLSKNSSTLQGRKFKIPRSLSYSTSYRLIGYAEATEVHDSGNTTEWMPFRGKIRVKSSDNCPGLKNIPKIKNLKLGD